MGGGTSAATYAIAEVLDQINDLQPPGLDLGVEPFGKRLLLDGDPALLLSKRHLGQEVLMRRFGGGEGGLWVGRLVLFGACASLAATEQGGAGLEVVVVVGGLAVVGSAVGGDAVDGLGTTSLEPGGLEQFGVLAAPSQRCRWGRGGFGEGDAAEGGTSGVVAAENVGAVVRDGRGGGNAVWTARGDRVGQDGGWW